MGNGRNIGESGRRRRRRRRHQVVSFAFKAVSYFIAIDNGECRFVCQYKAARLMMDVLVAASEGYIGCGSRIGRIRVGTISKIVAAEDVVEWEFDGRS